MAQGGRQAREAGSSQDQPTHLSVSGWMNTAAARLPQQRSLAKATASASQPSTSGRGSRGPTAGGQLICRPSQLLQRAAQRRSQRPPAASPQPRTLAARQRHLLHHACPVLHAARRLLGLQPERRQIGLAGGAGGGVGQGRAVLARCGLRGAERRELGGAACVRRVRGVGVAGWVVILAGLQAQTASSSTRQGAAQRAQPARPLPTWVVVPALRQARQPPLDRVHQLLPLRPARRGDQHLERDAVVAGVVHQARHNVLCLVLHLCRGPAACVWRSGMKGQGGRGGWRGESARRVLHQRLLAAGRPAGWLVHTKRQAGARAAAWQCPGSLPGPGPRPQTTRPAAAHLPGTTMKGVTLPSSALTGLASGGAALGPVPGGTLGWPQTIELYVASEPAGGVQGCAGVCRGVQGCAGCAGDAGGCRGLQGVAGGCRVCRVRQATPAPYTSNQSASRRAAAMRPLPASWRASQEHNLPDPAAWLAPPPNCTCQPAASSD
jgi:hypothetical protein